MPAWVAPVVAGGMSILGSVARGLLDESYDVDASGTRALHGETAFNVEGIDYGSQAAAAEGRVTGVKNPYATGAMWDQEWARQQQEDTMADLWATAKGEQNFARERGEDDARAMQNMMFGTAAGASRFDTGARGAAAREANMLPYGMSADINVAAKQEQDSAQNLLQGLLANQQQQDDQAIGAWNQQETIESGQTLAGGKSALDILKFGGARKRRRLKEEPTIQGIGAKAEAND